MEIIIRKDYYEPLEITIPDLIKEFEKKRNNPRGYPFMDTFRSWILYCEDNGEDVSAFEEDLPELEKAQTLAIIEEKIGWAEENPAEAHICLMSEIKELMKRTEVPEKIYSRWLELCEKEAIAGLEARFRDAENHFILSAPIGWLAEAIENARSWGYDVSDYEDRRLPAIEKNRALGRVKMLFYYFEDYASTMKPITEHEDWMKEIIELECFIDEAEELGCDISKYRDGLPELRRKISMNEVKKIFWKQKIYPEKSSCLPQNISLLINQAEREGNNVADARKTLKGIML